MADVTAAIELVARGRAYRVTLVGLADPAALAPVMLAVAQAARVQFALERNPSSGTAAIVVGPVMPQ